MRVTQLSLTDFRSYRQLDLGLGPGVTTLVGSNGQGKTNIVEALRYVSILSSHRVASDLPLVRRGAETATVRVNVEKAGRSLTLEVTIAAAGANAARLNRNPVRPREIAGILRTVVFSPEDLDLVRGEPAARRRFMDELCVARSPRLAGDLADYERVVRQKSALLKAARGRSIDEGLLDVWDSTLAALGAQITMARGETIERLAPFVGTAYREVSSGAECSLAYDASVDPNSGEVEGRLLEAIRVARPKERERGVCLVGPHRDELDIGIGGLPSRGYASHGESWSCALALRIATFDLLTSQGEMEDVDGEPVLILDDVFAELDAQRREALARRVSSAPQAVITAAVPQDVPASLGGAAFVVAEGEVTRVS